MTYQPPGYFQIDGSAFAQSNCVLATSTDLIDRATVGGLRVPANRLRVVTGDTSGGVTYGQAVMAVFSETRRLGNTVVLEARFGLSRAQVRDLLAAGRACGVSILALVTRYTTRRTGTFVGGHTVYAQRRRWITVAANCQCETVQPGVDHGEALIEDPGTSAGYLWWSEDLLFRAAEARTGNGTISVLAGPDTEGVTRIARGSGQIRSQPSTTSTAKRAIVLGKSYPVIETANGGPWQRDQDGHTATGWAKVRYGTTATGWIRGEVLHAA